MNTTPSFEYAIDQLCGLQLEDTAIATLCAEGTPLKFFDILEKCWLPGNGSKTAWSFLKAVSVRLQKMSLEDRQLLFGNKTRDHFDTLKRLDKVLCGAPCEAHFQLTNNTRQLYGPHPHAQIAIALPQTAQIRFSSDSLRRYNPACHIICDEGMTLLDWFDPSIVAAGYPASAIIKIRLFGTNEDATLDDLASWLDAYTNPETREEANSKGSFIGQKPIPSNCGQVTPDGKGVVVYIPDGYFTQTSVVHCDTVMKGHRGREFKPLCSVSDYPNPGQGYVLFVVFDGYSAFVKHFKIPCQKLDEQDWQRLVELNNVDLDRGSTVPLCYSAESAERIRDHATRLPDILKDYRMAGPLPPNHLKDCHYLFSFNY